MFILYCFGLCFRWSSVCQTACQTETRCQWRPPEGASVPSCRELDPSVTLHQLVPLAKRRSESERVLGFGFVPVARRQALFRVEVLRVYPNVQHLGVSARLSESWGGNTQTERVRDWSKPKNKAANITSGADQIVLGAVETRGNICKTETTL